MTIQLFILVYFIGAVICAYIMLPKARYYAGGLKTLALVSVFWPIAAIFKVTSYIFFLFLLLFIYRGIKK